MVKRIETIAAWAAEQIGERRYYYDDQGWHAPRPTCLWSLLALLHEQGHVACGHRPRPGYVDYVDLVQEAAAWRYAFRCVRLSDAQAWEALALYLECMHTYNTALEVNYGEWLSDDELFCLLKEEKG